MGYADKLWLEQVQLVDAVMRANDSATVNDLMCRYAVATQKYLAISSDEQLSKHGTVHVVLKFFLEQAGIADEGAVAEIHTVPSVESVANLLGLFPPLKQYCEDMYFNNGIVGALKYGASPVLGHDILLPALKLCKAE